MIPTQQSHTLPSRTSRHTSQNLAKSVSAPALQKSKPIPSKNFKNATHSRYKNSWIETAKTPTDKGLTMTVDRRPACNTGLAKVAVQCSADTFVVNQTLVLRINICGENRHLRQARNRYLQGYDDRANIKLSC